jgi:hypothetical protein
VRRKTPVGMFNTLFGLVNSRDLPKRCMSCEQVQPLENFYVRSSKEVGHNPDLSQPKNFRHLCCDCWDEKN